MGQHRKQLRRRRWPLVALGAVLAVAAGVVVVQQVGRANACRPVAVSVAVDPVLEGAVRRALTTDPDELDACTRYDVTAAPADLASEIRAGQPGLPVVWIPASSLVLGAIDEGSGTLVQRGEPLASSPVVLAVPTADAARYGDPTRPVPWTAVLTSGTPPALPDPVVEPGGLAALTALRTSIGDDAGRPKPAFVAAVLALSEEAPESTEVAFEAVERDGVAARAFVTSEQSVVAHNGLGPAGTDAPAGPPGEDAPTAAAVSAVALAEGGAALDYPFVRLVPQGGGDRPAVRPAEVERAVDRLEERLRGPIGRQALAAAGFRAPDGSRAPGTAATGALPAEKTSTTVPDPVAALETLRLWSALTLQNRILAVIDTSGSMAAREGPSDRISLAAAAAQGGLTLFPDSSSVGLWAFSSDLAGGLPWQELVPIGRLTEPLGAAPSRRAALAAASTTLRDRLGGETALYDTVIAATRAVRAGYQPGASNAVVLITDGRNEVDGGIDLPTAVQTLRAEADPTRPVPLIAIGIGPDSDIDALRQLAEATGGGQAYVAENPQDIRTVFLDALSQRVCRPGC
ncbi:MAG TPA: VWA domain-containing protein [Pseudonocardia sp.]|nr:VWA domain-containing protein [Pseudonocardia sp.]